MRKLTFRGFTKQYVKQLSLTGSTGISSLVQEMSSGNPRLREPILLYAASNGNAKFLLRVSKGAECHAEYARLLAHGADSLIRDVEQDSPQLPYEYRKVWHSYQSVLRGYERNARVKALMRNKIILAQKETGVSTREICAALGIDVSNVSAWLKNGDNSRIGIEKARTIFRYMEQQNGAAR